MKVFFNTPNANLKGGPPTHLPYLEQGLRGYCAVFPYEYGRKSDNETTRQKVFGRIGDLLSTGTLISAIHPDIIHHNSAFDPRAILRDAPLALLAKKYHTPLFIKVHGSLPEAFTTRSRLIKTLRSSLINNVSAFGVLSTIERNEFEEAFPELSGRVSVVKNILSNDFFSVEREESQQPTFFSFHGLFVAKESLTYWIRCHTFSISIPIQNSRSLVMARMLRNLISAFMR